MKQPNSNFEALVGALYLALTATTDENVKRAVELAESFCPGLSGEEIHNAKLIASAKANGRLEIIAG